MNYFDWFDGVQSRATIASTLHSCNNLQQKSNQNLIFFSQYNTNKTY